MMAMEERKTSMLVGVKTSWSRATRARIVGVEVGEERRIMRRWRNVNHVVAAGPNTARFRVLVGEGERGVERRGDVPPP